MHVAQLWVSILSPSASSFDAVVAPVIALARDRLAGVRLRHPPVKAA